MIWMDDFVKCKFFTLFDLMCSHKNDAYKSVGAHLTAYVSHSRIFRDSTAFYFPNRLINFISENSETCM